MSTKEYQALEKALLDQQEQVKKSKKAATALLNGLGLLNVGTETARALETKQRSQKS